MTDKEKDLTEELKELVPIDLLTEEQLGKAILMEKLDSIKYIHSIINDGTKIAKAYYDLYVDVLPKKYIPGLSARVVEYDAGWYTVEITYNGEVIKTIRK